MKKVAFLLLTDKGFNREDIWVRFFDSKDVRWNLYVHSKQEPSSEWIKSRQIPQKFKTQWAEFSLVKAQNALLEKALKNRENSVFVLISESHCPLYPISETIDRLLELDLPIFSRPEGEDLEYRYKRSGFSEVTWLPKHNFSFSSQWWVFDRSTAKFFVQTKDSYEKWFRTTSFADEHYYKTLCNYAQIPFYEKDVTYINWKLKTAENYSKIAKRSHPKTYFKVKPSFIRLLREKGYLFFRKVDSRTKIPIRGIFNVKF